MKTPTPPSVLQVLLCHRLWPESRPWWGTHEWMRQRWECRYTIRTFGFNFPSQQNSCVQFITCADLQMSCAGHGCSQRPPGEHDPLGAGSLAVQGRHRQGQGLADGQSLPQLLRCSGVCCPLPCPTVQEQPQSVQRGGRNGHRHNALYHIPCTVYHIPGLRAVHRHPVNISRETGTETHGQDSQVNCEPR